MRRCHTETDAEEKDAARIVSDGKKRARFVAREVVFRRKRPEGNRRVVTRLRNIAAWREGDPSGLVGSRFGTSAYLHELACELPALRGAIRRSEEGQWRAFRRGRTKPRARRAPRAGKKFFSARVSDVAEMRKRNDASGFGATAVIRFRAPAYHATPAPFIDDDHHLHIGPRRVIRLRRELVLSLGLFVRDAKYFAHEPSTLHGYLAARGSERLAARPSGAGRGARAQSVASARMNYRTRASLRHARAGGGVGAFRGEPRTSPRKSRKDAVSLIRGSGQPEPNSK